MMQFLRKLFGTRGSARPAPRRRSVRLGLESLDERIVPSAVQAVGDVTGSALGNQSLISDDRTVARCSSNGNYAVTWCANGINVRLFRADNTPLTGVMHLASTTAGKDYHPSIAMNANGQFVVAWEHLYTSSSGSSDGDIYMQRFNANGTPSYQRAVAWSPHYEFEPSVALDNYGNVMVAYTYQYSSGDNDIHVWMERASGPTSTIYLANSFTNEHAPSLALNQAGSGVVAWEYDYSDGIWTADDHDIYARRVSTGGYSGTPAAIGGNISVITDGENQIDPSVSINDSNNFVVSYTEQGEYGQGYRAQVFARRFDSANNYLGGVGVGDSWDTRDETESSVAMDAYGRFIVAYTHQYSDTDRDVRAQVFNSDNTARGPSFYVSGFGSYSEYTPTVALGVTDLTSNYSGGGYYYGTAVFSFETYGLKKDAWGNKGYGVSVARAWQL